MANAWETCEVSVGGQTYSSWESVTVHTDFAHPPPTFTLVTDGNAQINPGDDCIIKLGGKLALTGFVNVIQPAYDANRHSMQIQGRSKSQDCIDCSIMHDKARNGTFDGQTLQQIGNTLLKEYPTKLKVLGKDMVLPQVQVQPTESPYNAIERYASQIGLYLIHDENGDILAINDPIGSSAGELVEGKNIKACRAVISDMSLHSIVRGLAQRNGSDKESGRKVSQPKAESEKIEGSTRHRPYCFFGVRTCTDDLLKSATGFETQWRGAVHIDATITVYGWLMGGKQGELWKPARTTKVTSPMARIGQDLWIKAVTYTQSNQSGTESHIDLIRYPQQGKLKLTAGGGGQDPTGNPSTIAPGAEVSIGTPQITQ